MIRAFLKHDCACRLLQIFGVVHVCERQVQRNPPRTDMIGKTIDRAIGGVGHPVFQEWCQCRRPQPDNWQRVDNRRAASELCQQVWRQVGNVAAATEHMVKALSLGMIKRIAWAAADVSLEQALQNERLGQLEASRTDDFVEGVTAFAGKRVPEFKGR